MSALLEDDDMSDFDEASFSILKEIIASDECVREAVELETLLTSVPAIAPESGGGGESEKCGVLESYLADHGFKHFSHYDAPDARVKGGFRPNLTVTLEGDRSDFSVWVISHLDVVPPGNIEAWQSDPWVLKESKDGRLTGRGVEDNQQGIVSSVIASLAFLKSGIVPRRDVKLLFIADEECGSAFGIQYLLKEHSDLFKKDDLILIPDGGDSEGKNIEIAEKNILWLRAHTIGAQSHGSSPQRGKNAAIAGYDLALRLNALENVFSKRDELFSPSWSTFQPTKKESNVQSVNIIPGDDVFYMDCRVLPCYTLAEVKEQIASQVKATEDRYGVKISVEALQAEESPATSENAPIVKALSFALEKSHGIKAIPVGIGGGTVAAYLRAAGFPAAVWSTIENTCHQPNEYCLIKNIIKDAQTLAALFLL